MDQRIGLSKCVEDRIHTQRAAYFTIELETHPDFEV